MKTPPNTQGHPAKSGGSTPPERMLWHPGEALGFYVLIVFGFGFIIGDGDYAFAMKLFAPVAVLGVTVAGLQLVVGATRALRSRQGPRDGASDDPHRTPG